MNARIDLDVDMYRWLPQLVIASLMMSLSCRFMMTLMTLFLECYATDYTVNENVSSLEFKGSVGFAAFEQRG